MDIAPIVLFVYNRPWHTRKTVEALKNARLANESILYIYSDGPKNNHENGAVRAVREYIRTIAGFKQISIIERDTNFGLANSIIDGVTSVVRQYGKIIVLEDDLVVAQNFLEFMNEALVKYRDESSVFSISGFSHSDTCDNLDSTYFLALTSSWGWATWAEKWKYFRKDPELLKMQMRNDQTESAFNYHGSYDFCGMARMQLDGKIDSWAIYWYASVSCENGLTLYPAKSLVQNIGFDNSGTHSGSRDIPELKPFSYSCTECISEKVEIRDRICKIFKGNRENLISRFIRRLKHLGKKFSSIVYYYSWLMNACELFFIKSRVGQGTYIDKTVSLFGLKNISIGENSVIGEGTWLNVNVRTPGIDHIVIGNNVYIGRRNTLSSSRVLKISDYVMTGNEVHLFGANHLYSDPMKPYIATGVSCDETLVIGVNVWLGGGVTVCGDLHIGHGSIIGAGSVVTKSIPPFSIAVGNPCKVIKRFDFKAYQWVGVHQINNLDDIEAQMPSEDEYLAELKKKYSRIIMPAIAATTGNMP